MSSQLITRPAAEGGMERVHRLAGAALAALILTLSLPLASADDDGPPLVSPIPWAPFSAGVGVCVSQGDLPGTPPTVQHRDCGPRVILRVVTPDGTREMDVGACREECEATLVLVLVLCPPETDPRVHVPYVVEADRWREIDEALERALRRPVGDGGSVYEARVGDGCPG